MRVFDFSRLCCSSLTFRRFPLEAALEAMVSLKIPHVEIGAFPDFAPHFPLYEEVDEDAFVKMVSSFPINVKCFNTGGGGFNDPALDAERLHEAIKRVMRVAQRLGAQSIGVAGGKAIDRAATKPDADIALMGPHLRRLAHEAQQHHLRLTIEAPHSGGLVHNADEAMLMIQHCNHANAHLIFDCAHHFRSGWEMTAAVQRIGNRIGHVHLRDRNANDNVYPLGTGLIDFAAVFRELDALGYHGLFSFEMPEAGQTVEQARQTVKESMDYLRSLQW